MSNVTETFGYDYLHRLQSSTRSDLPGVTGTVSIQYRYDALGNLIRKSDFSDSYSYGGAGQSCSGSSPAGPNAVTAANNITYGYDASGNLICDNQGSQMVYDPYNQPTSILKNGSLATFAYGSDGQRYRQGGDRDILYIDKLYERHNQSKHQYYIGDYAVITDEGAGRQINYLHTDRLGSIIAISNEQSQINTDEQRGYDPFGKPREYDWNDSDPNDGSNGDLNGYEQTTWGYTGHEHLNGTNLIHMNGRVYDYNLGRFMSVDPVIQFANNSQSFNGYSYIMNNPMSGTDPSGYMAETGCGSSNSGGCGASGADTAGDANAVTYEVIEESITGSRTRTRKSLKVSTPDGSAIISGGQIATALGNAKGAIAAIGIVMAYLAGEGNGAASGQTTNTMGGEGGDGEAADTGNRASTPSSDGGATQNASGQGNGVENSRANPFDDQASFLDQVLDVREGLRKFKEFRDLEEKSGELSITNNEDEPTEYNQKEGRININSSTLESEFKTRMHGSFEDSLRDLDDDAYFRAIDSYPEWFGFTLERIIFHETFHSTQKGAGWAALLTENSAEIDAIDATNQFMWKYFNEPFRLDHGTVRNKEK